MLRQQLVPDLAVAVPLPGVQGVWAVHQSSGADTGMQLASPGGPLPQPPHPQQPQQGGDQGALLTVQKVLGGIAMGCPHGEGGG